MKEQKKEQLDLSSVEFPEDMFLTAKDQDRKQNIETFSEMLEDGRVSQFDLSNIEFPEEMFLTPDRQEHKQENKALLNSLKIDKN